MRVGKLHGPHRRRVRIGGQVARVEDIEAVDPTEVQAATGGTELCEAVVLLALQAIRRVVVAEASCSRIETAQAIVAADPPRAIAGWFHAVEELVRQAVVHTVVAYYPKRGAIELHQSVVGTDPQVLAIVVQIGHAQKLLGIDRLVEWSW